MFCNNAHPERQKSNERGSIIIMTAIFMLLLFLMLGLCIDVSRIYMVRTELQNAADAAAITGAREINAGTTGIDNAVAKATSIANTVGFAKLGITIDTVTFGAGPDGPWLDAATAKQPANVTTIKFVRVQTHTATTFIRFGMAALGGSHVEGREAVAGMSIGITGFCDYYPIALAKTNPTVSYPVNTPLDIHFVDGTGNTVNVPDSSFVVL